MLKLLDHASDPRTDLGFEVETGPRFARHQPPPVLHRMRVRALDAPAGVRVLMEKDVTSLDCFDEHPLGADLVSHGWNASSTQTVVLRSFLVFVGSVGHPSVVGGA